MLSILFQQEMSLVEQYHHLTHYIVPGPQSISYFLPLILLPTALLIPRITLSRWQNSAIFLTLILLSTAHAWNIMGCIDVISVNAVLWSFYFLLLKDPWKDFRRVPVKAPAKHSNEDGSVAHGSCDGISVTGSQQTARIYGTTSHSATPNTTKPDEEEEPYPTTLSPRIPWILRLLGAIRLNDWKIGVPSHDIHQPPPPAFKTRLDFVIQALISFTRGYILLDLTSVYTQTYDPYFRSLSIPLNSPLPAPFTPLPPQLTRATIIGLQAWILISQMFYLPCLLPILLNYLGILPSEWSPHTWATYFGSPSSIFLHGVRGFWGTYWHQTMRHSCSGPGYALAELLGLRSGGIGRYFVISAVAFGLSGVVHMGLVPPEPLKATVTPNTIRLYIGGFFWLQPVGMLIEVLVIRLLEWSGIARRWQQGRSSTLRTARFAINGIWVIYWFSLCLPLLGEAARQLNYCYIWLVPLSLWKWMRGEECVMWKVHR